MTDTRATTVLLMLALAGLFLRMNQLQGQVLAALSGGPAGVPARDVSLPVGMAAPDFTLPDLAGKSVSLKDFAGKPLLLAFSSTTCPACQRTYPHLRAFSEVRRDIRAVMISRGMAGENQRMVTAQGFSFPVLVWDDAVAQQYKVPGTPFFVVVDGQGVITAAGFANAQAELARIVLASAPSVLAFGPQIPVAGIAPLGCYYTHCWTEYYWCGSCSTGGGPGELRVAKCRIIDVCYGSQSGEWEVARWCNACG